MLKADFVLVLEPLSTRVSVIRSIFEKKTIVEKTITTFYEGNSLVTITEFEGSIHKSIISKNADRTHTVFVQYIFSGKALVESKTVNGEVSVGVKEILALSQGSRHGRDVFNSLVQKALAEGSNKLIVEFQAQNKRIFKIMYKRFKYLGRFPTNSFGESAQKGIHRFEINCNSFHILPPEPQGHRGGNKIDSRST